MLISAPTGSSPLDGSHPRQLRGPESRLSAPQPRSETAAGKKGAKSSREAVLGQLEAPRPLNPIGNDEVDARADNQEPAGGKHPLQDITGFSQHHPMQLKEHGCDTPDPPHRVPTMGIYPPAVRRTASRAASHNDRIPLSSQAKEIKGSPPSMTDRLPDQAVRTVGAPPGRSPAGAAMVRVGITDQHGEMPIVSYNGAGALAQCPRALEGRLARSPRPKSAAVAAHPSSSEIRARPDLRQSERERCPEQSWPSLLGSGRPILVRRFVLDRLPWLHMGSSVRADLSQIDIHGLESVSKHCPQQGRPPLAPS
jgi:hypothetical protein